MAHVHSATSSVLVSRMGEMQLELVERLVAECEHRGVRYDDALGGNQLIELGHNILGEIEPGDIVSPQSVIGTMVGQLPKSSGCRRLTSRRIASAARSKLVAVVLADPALRPAAAGCDAPC